MRRAGNLYDRIYELDNLNMAFLKAIKGKIRRSEVVTFRRNFQVNMKSLQSGLQSLSPSLGDYRFFKVYDPKERLISQHLANFYLGYFDHWIKEQRRIKGYLRYMDDFILFSDRRRKLKDELDLIRDFLNDELRLKLKNSIQLNNCSHGIPFLGFRIFPEKLLLTAAKRRRFVTQFRNYEESFVAGAGDEKVLQRRVLSLVESTRMAEAAAFRNGVIKRFGISF